MLPDLGDQTDHRQWTQQHLDAADLRAPSMAPTPPQGEIDADCMDVNVRGPGMMTIQMHFPLIGYPGLGYQTKAVKWLLLYFAFLATHFLVYNFMIRS